MRRRIAVLVALMPALALASPGERAEAGPYGARSAEQRFEVRPPRARPRTAPAKRSRWSWRGRWRRRPLSLAEMSADSLARAIAERRIASIEQLIEILPEAVRENVILLPFTRSAQRGSLEEPRTVLFAPDASLLIGMGRDAAHGQSGSIEVMELDEVRGRWKFRQLGLGGKKPAPLKCSKCHRGRPIWDSGGRWPEAFGQQWMDSDRATDYLQLVRSRREPYSRLRLPDSAHDIMGQNRRFTLLLQHADAHRAARAIADLPDEPAHRTALTAAFADRDLADIARALPGRPPASSLEPTYRRLLASTEREIRAYVANRDQRARATGLRSSDDQMRSELDAELRAAPRVAKLRLVFSRMGHPELMDDWSLARTRAERPDGSPLRLHGRVIPWAAGNYGFAHSDPHQREGDALDFIAYRYLERVGARVEGFFRRSGTSGLGYDVELIQIDPGRVRDEPSR